MSVHPPTPFCLPPKLPASAPLPDLLRPLPRPFDTFEQWHVFHHLDLPEMDAAQLHAEAAAVSARIAFEGRSNAWFFERLAAIRARLHAVEAVR